MRGLPGPALSFAILAVAVLGVGLCAPASASQIRYQSRFDSLDKAWVWGNLTWEGGQGRIAWGAAPEEPMTAGTSSGVPPTTVFTTAPLDRPLYMDASRKVMLGIYLKKTTSSPTCVSYSNAVHIEVTLWAGAAYVASADSSSPMGLFAPAPDGYVSCPFRIPLEARHVPAGSILQLNVSFVGQGPFEFYFGSQAPSFFALPTFPEEEAAYRMPEVFPRARPRVSESLPDDAGQWLGGLASMGSMVVFAMPRSSRGRPENASVRRLTAAILLVPLLAGCLGGPANTNSTAPLGAAGPSSGEALVEYYDRPTDRNETVRTGTISGQVSEIYGMPVIDAFVALLGTPQATRSDSNGLFHFGDLSPGAFRIRVDHEGYQSVETSVDVLPGKVAKVELVMAYDDSLGAGERRHRHDYWNGAERAVLFEGPVYYRNCPAGERCAQKDEFYVEPQDDDLRLVRPGTIEIEATLDWAEGAECSDRTAFGIQDNMDANPQNWTVYKARARGEPFRIQTTWEMTDVGHQRFSTWTFGVIGGCYPYPVDSGAPFAAIEKLILTIKRGALPLEPAHPDHWKGETSMSVAGGVWKSPIGGNILAPPFCHAGKKFNGPTALQDNSDTWATLGPPSGIIPVGTRWLTLFVNQTSTHGTVEGVDSWAWKLWYHTGAEQPTPYQPGDGAWIEGPAPELSPDRVSWSWRLAVDDEIADGMYNKKSAWSFVLVPDNRPLYCLAQLAGSSTSAAWAVHVVRE